MSSINVMKAALAGGTYVAICAVVITVAALLKVPGAVEFTDWLVMLYSSYGYQVTWLGVLIGAFWGFVEGFVHVGLFSLVYNWVAGRE